MIKGTYGGALSFLNIKNVSISNAIFSNNVGWTGGALQIVQNLVNTTNLLTNLSFISNYG